MASVYPEYADGHLFAKLFGLDEEPDILAGRVREFIKKEPSFEVSLQPTLG